MVARRSRWYTSRRRDRLPADWQRIRALVSERAGGRCQAKRHARGCNGIGTDCDHIIPGDDDSLDNLQWLSSACHKAKTADETRRRNMWYAKTKRHPVENNPGCLSGPGGGCLPGRLGETAG
jgi:5-methylcytosine-specific restriction endonuclease McrA